MSKAPAGWAGTILRVCLSRSESDTLATETYSERFIGGRGIASKLYWDEVSPTCNAFSPDNCLYIMNGPLGGTLTPATSRCVVVARSPMARPEQYAVGSLGGTFGAALKWAGLDGMIISGAASHPVILVIEPGQVCRFEDAGNLWGSDTFQTITLLEQQYGPECSVATIGHAGEALVRFATIAASGGAMASKGFGAVMGSKNLKAIVVHAPRIQVPMAYPEQVKKVRKDITSLWKGEDSGRFYPEVNTVLYSLEKTRNEFCFGCPGTCRRGIYRSPDGESGHRKVCFSSFFYSPESGIAVSRDAIPDDVTFHATQQCNRHGLCVLELKFLATWLPRAIRQGRLDPGTAALDPGKRDPRAWLDQLIDVLLKREGIGDILAEGSPRAAEALGVEDLLEGIVTPTGFDADFYNPRLYITTAVFYAVEPVFPITMFHAISFPTIRWMYWRAGIGFLDAGKLQSLARDFWGDERAAMYDRHDKKGQAACIVQNRAYAKENFVLCDWFWPIDYTHNRESGVGDPNLEAHLFTAVTGNKMDTAGFLRSGEICANLCRAIYLREGRRGRCDDALEPFNYRVPKNKHDPPGGVFNPELEMPGGGDEIVIRKGLTMDPEWFRLIMDEYYATRGWDIESGLFTEKNLRLLGLDELLPELRQMGFLAK